MARTISVTLLPAYLYCPRKLYLEHVLGIREIPKEVTVVGKIRHSVYDLVNRQEKGIVLSVTEHNIQDIEEKYKASYSRTLKNSIKLNKSLLHKLDLNLVEVYKKIWPLVLEEARARSAVLSSAAQKHRIFGAKLWEALTPKIESEVFVSSQTLGLKGKVDRIEKHGDKVIPVELKTGRAPKDGVWEGHLIQIGAYMLLLEEQYGKPVPKGIVEYLNDKVKRNVRMNPFIREDIVRLKEKVLQLLESDHPPPMVQNQNKCRTCGLRERCQVLDRENPPSDKN